MPVIVSSLASRGAMNEVTRRSHHQTPSWQDMIRIDVGQTQGRSTRTGSSKMYSIERTLLPLRGCLNVYLVRRLGEDGQLCWASGKGMTVGRPRGDGEMIFASELMGCETSSRW